MLTVADIDIEAMIFMPPSAIKHIYNCHNKLLYETPNCSAKTWHTDMQCHILKESLKKHVLKYNLAVLKLLCHRNSTYHHGVSLAQSQTTPGLTTHPNLGIGSQHPHHPLPATITGVFQCMEVEVDTITGHTVTFTIHLPTCPCPWSHVTLGGMMLMGWDHIQSIHAILGIHLPYELATCPQSRIVICGLVTHSDTCKKYWLRREINVFNYYKQMNQYIHQYITLTRSRKNMVNIINSFTNYSVYQLAPNCQLAFFCSSFH